ncbi:hypothetical protein [Actinocorallia longicatena]|uniref:hypothetical protein n=1 Tax=Actinocorallia longicatena TaxID=111803 RepID=UPI0031D6C3D2
MERFPEFGEMYECHLANNGGLLPHVFFAVDGVTEEVVSAYSGRVSEWTEGLDWRAVLGFLEGAYIEGDGEARGVIAVSFVHRLPWPGQIGERIVGDFGPGLAECHRDVR